MSHPTLAIALLALVSIPGCGGKKDAENTSGSPTTSGSPIVEIETSMGAIRLELDAEKAPLTVENFLDYVDAGHFDGTVFHRVIKEFMIQGGGFAPRGSELVEKETRKPIKNEAKNGLSNLRGTIAMARTNDPDSATAQFFINVVDNQKSLDPGAFNPDGYAVFGKVISGMEVADKIRAVATGNRPLTQLTPDGREVRAPSPDVPLTDVVIKSVRRIKG